VAQYNLGRAYLDGDSGVTKSIRHARTWLKRAAENNYRPARLLLNRLEKTAL
jgi:TPR repeat protein